MYPSIWSCDKVNNKGCENLWLKSAFAFTMKKTIMVHEYNIKNTKNRMLFFRKSEDLLLKSLFR